MKIIMDINIVCKSVAGEHAFLRKEFKSDIIPIPGMFIEDTAWKKPRKPSAIHDPKDTYTLMKGITRYKRERVYSLLLDGENGVMGCEKLSRGSDGLVDAYPDQVFRSALDRECKSIILVHNHPSGFPYPSDQDRTATRNLYRWGRNIGIELQDSVIVALGGFYSFRESGALQAWGQEK